MRWWWATIGLASILVYSVSSGSFTGASSLPETHIDRAVADGGTGSRLVRALGIAEPEKPGAAGGESLASEGEPQASLASIKTAAASADREVIPADTEATASSDTPPGTETLEAQPVTMSVTGSHVNLRAEPSGRSSRLARLPRGTLVELIETSGAWAKVAPPDGGEPGWMHSRYLRALSTARETSGSAG